MDTFQTVSVIAGGLCCLLVTAIPVFVAWRIIATNRATNAQEQDVLDRLQPVTDALDAQRPPDPTALQRLAADPLTRAHLWAALDEYARRDLMPAEHDSDIAFAQSQLVFWLAHPNELTSVPDEIELVDARDVQTDSAAGLVRYFLFRYRVNEPHWAAKYDWIAGLAGPYVVLDDGSIDRRRGLSPFSVIQAWDSYTTDEYFDQHHDRRLSQLDELAPDDDTDTDSDSKSGPG